MSRKADMSQELHDFYTERWNGHWAHSAEPGWAICEDIAKLLYRLDVSPRELKKSLRELYPKEMRQANAK